MLKRPALLLCFLPALALAETPAAGTPPPPEFDPPPVPDFMLKKPTRPLTLEEMQQQADEAARKARPPGNATNTETGSPLPKDGQAAPK